MGLLLLVKELLLLLLLAVISSLQLLRMLLDLVMSGYRAQTPVDVEHDLGGGAIGNVHLQPVTLLFDLKGNWLWAIPRGAIRHVRQGATWGVFHQLPVALTVS